MSSRHAITPRGLNATRSSLSQGRFGRMFRNLTPAKFGANDADNTDSRLNAEASVISAALSIPLPGTRSMPAGVWMMARRME